MNDSGAAPARRRSATAMSGRALQQRRDPTLQERAERWEERLSIPVLVAALVSVPAIFLMTADGAPATVGRVLNWASMVVLFGESLVLVLLSKDIVDWLRAHKWELLLAAVTVPAVVFAVGPVQILRVVLSVGTLRILRVRRILRAGKVLARRMRLGARRRKLVIGGVVVLAGGFLAIVLANPQSRTRRVLRWLVEHLGLPLTIIAGIVLAAALYFLLRRLSHSKLALLVRGRHRHAVRVRQPSDPEIRQPPGGDVDGRDDLQES